MARNLDIATNRISLWSWNKACRREPRRCGLEERCEVIKAVFGAALNDEAIQNYVFTPIYHCKLIILFVSTLKMLTTISTSTVPADCKAPLVSSIEILTPLATPEDSEDEVEAKYFDRSLPTCVKTEPDVTVAVIGTGYVGLHLVQAFSTEYNVIAFDVQDNRIQEIKSLVNDRVHCTTDSSKLSEASLFLISVSTVLDGRNQNIDTSCIQKAIQLVEQYARPDATVVIESSVSVGMTRDLLEPLIQRKSIKAGFSPERVDPGRTLPHYSTIPKIVSGLNSGSMESIQSLYSKVFQNIVPVSCPEVAEMTKLYENCQRMMNIAYANEMADACQQLSQKFAEKPTSLVTQDKTRRPPILNPWEVCRAAATKPFGYMPYAPSLGVGGHCIPVNPYYLTNNSDFPLLEACTKRMADRPARLGDQIMSTLTSRHPQTRLRLLVVGLGFKRGQSVLSHSPGKALAVHLLSTYDVYVEYADPLVSQDAVTFIPRLDEATEWNTAGLARFDAIVVAVNQIGLDMQVLKTLQENGQRVEWYCDL